MVWILPVSPDAAKIPRGPATAPQSRAGMVGRRLGGPATLNAPTGLSESAPGLNGSPEVGEAEDRSRMPFPEPTSTSYDVSPDNDWGAQPDYQAQSTQASIPVPQADVARTGDVRDHLQLSPDIAGVYGRNLPAPSTPNSWSGMPDFSDDRLEGLRANFQRGEYAPGQVDGPVQGGTYSDDGTIATSSPGPWSQPTLNVSVGSALADGYYG